VYSIKFEVTHSVVCSDGMDEMNNNINNNNFNIIKLLYSEHIYMFRSFKVTI